MKVINHDGANNDKKLLLFIGGALLAGIILIVIILFGFRKNDETSVPEQETETVPNFGTEMESEENLLEKLDTETDIGQSEKKDLKIEKQDEFITPVLGSFTSKVNDAIKGFMYQNNISAESAKCLDCAVAIDDTSCTEFYIQLNDDAQTLVTARYDPERAGVSVSYCVYSLEEIQEEVWMFDNGPSVRDTQEEPAYNETSLQNEQKVQGELNTETKEKSYGYSYANPVTQDTAIPAQETESYETDSVPNFGTNSEQQSVMEATSETVESNISFE